MNKHNSVSWKKQFALIVLCCALCLGIVAGIAFAYADNNYQQVSGSGLNEGTSTEPKVSIVAKNNAYTLSDDGYFREGASADGNYAFVQGMTSVSDVLSKLQSEFEIQLKDSSGTTTFPITSSNVTTTASDTGNSTSENVSIDLSVTIAGYDDPFTVALNFVQHRIYKLDWVRGEVSTVGKGLDSTSDASYTLSYLLDNDSVVAIYTDGQTSTVITNNLTTEDTLTPDYNVLANQQTTYSKVIYIKYYINGTIDKNVEPLAWTITDIANNVELTAFGGITGTPARQYANSPFVSDGLSFAIMYTSEYDSGTLYFPLSDFAQNDGWKITRYATRNNQDRDYLSTDVFYVYLSYKIPNGKGGFFEGNTRVQNLIVQQAPITQPTISNFNPVYADGGCKVVISNVLQDDNNPIVIDVPSGVSCVQEANGDYTLTFSKGGSFDVKVKLQKEGEGDYLWDTVIGDNPSYSNYELTYTISVAKAPISITHDFGAQQTYGNSEPNVKVTATYKDGGADAFEITKSQGGSTLPSGLTAPNIVLSYYGTYTDTTDGSTKNYASIAAPSATYPTEPGTYHVLVKTTETDQFAEGEAAEWFDFTITARPIDLTAMFTSPEYIRGKNYTIADLQNQININGLVGNDKNKIAQIFTIAYAKTYASVTHAGTYEVSLKINTLYQTKYKWSTGDAVDGTSNFVIAPRAQQVNVSLGVSSFQYGTNTNPNLTYTWITSSQYQYAQIAANATYNKKGDTTKYTIDGTTDFSKLEVGTYEISYDVTRHSDDIAADYALPSIKGEFTVTPATQEEVDLSVSGGGLFGNDWLYNPSAGQTSHWLGRYGTTLSSVLSNYTANTIASGTDPILTVTVNGVRLDGTAMTGLPTVISGTFNLTQAGDYTVTIALNKNYVWTNSSRVSENEGQNVTKTYFGSIEKALLSNLALTSSSTTYNAAEQSAQAKFSVNGGASAWNKDGTQSILTISKVTGANYAAQDLDGSKIDSDNGTFAVTNAGTYTATIAIADKFNYKWNDDGTTADKTLVFVVNRAAFKAVWGKPGETASVNGTQTLNYAYTDGVTYQPIPTYAVDYTGVANDNGKLTITGVQVYRNTEFTSAVSGNNITEANTYYIKVTGFTSDDDTYLNYITVNESDADKVSICFVIESFGLEIPVLNSGLTATETNPISFVYDGEEHKFSTYLSNLDKYLVAGNLARIKISVDNATSNNIAMRDVKLQDSNVVSYVITVSPATNYKWTTEGAGSADSENQVFTYYVKITQLAINVSWTNTTLTYIAGTSQAPTPAIDNLTSYALDTAANVTCNVTGKQTNAGQNYHASVLSLSGSRASNYTVTGATNNDCEYKILKQVVAKPTVNKTVDTFSGSNIAFTYTFATSHNATWYAANVVASASGKDWFDRAISDGVSYASGALTVLHAGNYTVNFALSDEAIANYCFSASEQSDFAASDKTLYAYSDTFTVNRASIIAPALGAQRTIQFAAGQKLVPNNLSGTITTTNGITFKYTKQYGTYNKDGGYSTPADELPGATVQGQVYYVVLAFDASNLGNQFDYIWLENEADTDGRAILARTLYGESGSGQTAYGEAVNTQSEVKMYLWYAITKQVLQVKLNLKGYNFGDNGYVGGVNAVSAEDLYANSANLLDVFNIVKLNGSVTDEVFNNDKGLLCNTTAQIKLSFYADSARSTAVSADNLVNNLPWNANTYYVVVEVIFDSSSSDYENLEFPVQQFVVSPRVIEVEWTGDTEVTYDGEAHTRIATITNMPQKEVGGTVAAPTVKVSSVTNVLWQSNVVKAQTISITGLDTSDANAANLTVTGMQGNTTELKITPAPLKVAGVATTHVYGDSLAVYNGSNYTNYFTVDPTTPIYANDTNGGARVIKIAIKNTSNVEVTDKLAAVYGGTFNVVPELVNVRGNYELEATPAAFTVQQRTITVVINSDNGKTLATSVYFTDPLNLLNNPSVYTLTVTNGDGTKVHADNAVVSLSHSVQKASAVGYYDITCSVINDNYALSASFDGTDKYEVTPAAIGNISVSAYGAPSGIVYDGISHDILSVSATTSNSQELTWYYKLATEGDEAWTVYKVGTAAATKQAKNVNDSLAYNVKVEAPNHNPIVLDDAYTVSITKAQLNISVNLFIYFGENSPTNYDGSNHLYKAQLSDLRTLNGIYTVTNFVGEESGKADHDAFYSNDNAQFNLTGSFSYGYKDTTYAKGDNVDAYVLVFDVDTLASDNYTFAGEEGTLNVQALPITVTVNNGADYVKTYDEFGVTGLKLLTVADDITAVTTLQKSSYSNNPDDKIVIDLPYTAYVNGLTTAALSEKEIDGTVKVITNDVLYSGNDYAGYDINVTLQSNCVVAGTTDTTFVATNKYIIERTINGITTENYELFNPKNSSDLLKKDGVPYWVYGDYSSTHTNGYKPSDIHRLTEFAMRHIANDSKLAMAIYKDGIVTAISEKEASSNGEIAATLSVLFGDAHTAGAFGAGSYTVRYHMAQSNNYDEFTYELYFAIEKTTLTVAPINVDLVYGHELTDRVRNQAALAATHDTNAIFPYNIKGFVSNGGAVETLSQVLKIDGTLSASNKFTFVTDYQVGYANGSVGTYGITIDDKAYSADNYDIVYNYDTAATLTVSPREITIDIKFITANFDLSYIEGGNYVTKPVEKYTFTLDAGTTFATGDFTAPSNGVFDNDLQQVFTLTSAALDGLVVGSTTYKTNKVGTYAIYLVKGAHYTSAKDADKFNYTISVIRGVDVDSNSIDNKVPTQDNIIATTQCGVFTIEKAPLKIEFGDIHYLDGDTAKMYGENSVPIEDRDRYDGRYKLYQPYAIDGDGNKLSVQINAVYGGLAAGETYPKNKGTYTVSFTSDDSNYAPSISSTQFTIRPRVLTMTPSHTNGAWNNNTLTVSYNGLKHSITVTFAGLVDGEWLNLVTTCTQTGQMDGTFSTLSASNPNVYTFEAKNAGKYDITVTMQDGGSGAANPANYAFTGEYNTVKSLSYELDIDTVSITVNTASTTIQYGTQIKGYTVDGTLVAGTDARFAGFVISYACTSMTSVALNALIQQDIDDGLFDVTHIAYTTNGTNGTSGKYNYQTAQSGNTFAVTPSGITAYNFVITYASNGSLRVINREITVKVHGYADGNNYATSPYINGDPLKTNAWKARLNNFLTTDDVFTVTGHSLTTLGVELSLNTTTYNVGTYNIKAQATGNANYTVKFEMVGATYQIVKAHLTVNAINVSVTYGDELNALLTSANGNSNWSLLNGTYAAISGFAQGESYLALINNELSTYDSATQSNKLVFTTSYEPYVTGVPGNVAISLNTSTLNFTNYVVDNGDYVDATITVTPRTISASTVDQVYEEALDSDNNKIYNGGVHGKNHIAEITFTGHDNDDYIPAYTDTYKKAGTSGNGSATAPDRVGNYQVIVKLTTPNYVFDTNEANTTATAKTLNFNITKQKITPSWLYTGIENNPDKTYTDEQLTNVLAAYVQDLMQIDPFRKEPAIGSSFDLALAANDTEFNNGDAYKFGEHGVGLSIKVVGAGIYRITLRFNADAEKNYKWDDNDSVTFVELSFAVATNKIDITSLVINNWQYHVDGINAQTPTVAVSNGDTDGVIITYALIPTNKVPSSDDGYTKDFYASLNYTAYPFNAGYYVVKAYYPNIGGTAGDTQYAHFQITKAEVTLPTLNGGAATTYMFNGQRQSATVEFSSAELRIIYNGSYDITASGATVYATNKGNYSLVFALVNTNNYAWASGVTTNAGGNAVVTWTINKNDQANTDENKFLEITAPASIGYGASYTFTRKIKDGFNGNVSYFYSSDNTTWTNGSPKNVGNYSIKFVLSDGDINYTDKEVVLPLTITAKEITATASGTIVYGDTLDKATLTYVVEGLIGNDEVTVDAALLKYELADSYGKMIVGGSYEVILANDNGVVKGLSVANYVIKAQAGALTVTKRAVTLTLNGDSSQYGEALNGGTGTCDGLVYGDELDYTIINEADSVTGVAPVGIYALNATLNNVSVNDNYDVTIIPAAYEITQRRVYIGFESDLGGEFGNVKYVNVANCAITDAGGANIKQFCDDNNIGLVVRYSGSNLTSTTTQPVNAGSYIATISCSNTNFRIMGIASTQFIIDKKVVDETLLSFASQQYDGTAKTPAITDSNNGEGTIYTIEYPSNMISVGAYSIALKLKDADNYKWTATESAIEYLTFNITQATLTIRPYGTLTYGNSFADGNFGYTVVSPAGVDASVITATASNVRYVLVNSSLKPNQLDVDNYDLTMSVLADGSVSGLSSNNYKIVLAGNGTLKVTQRNITIQIGNASSVYNDSIKLDNTNFEIVAGTLPSWDDNSLLGVELKLVETTAKNVGNYTITANESLLNQNYNVTLRNGVYTIEALQVKIVVSATNGKYLTEQASLNVVSVETTNSAKLQQYTIDPATLTFVYSFIDSSNNITSVVPTLAGTYQARVTGIDDSNYLLNTAESFASAMLIIEKKELDASSIVVESKAYTGQPLNPSFDVSNDFKVNGEEIFEVLSHDDFVDVRVYQFSLRIKDKFFANYKWAGMDIENVSLQFAITKATNSLVSEVAGQAPTITITGWAYGDFKPEVNMPTASVKFGDILYYYSTERDGVYTDSIPSNGDAGEYWVRVTVLGTDNYERFDSEPVKFTIAKRQVALPKLILDGNNSVFTGNELQALVDGYDISTMDYSSQTQSIRNANTLTLTARNAGSYNITLILLSSNNYRWEDGATLDKDGNAVLTWTIAKQKVARPTDNTRPIIVNGEMLTYLPEGFDESLMGIRDNQAGYGGEFTAYVWLLDPDNYEWADSDLAELPYIWHIIGANTLFIIIVCSIGAGALALYAVALVQYLRYRKKKYAALQEEFGEDTFVPESKRKKEATEKTENTTEEENK